jgi:GntR family transcriptional regulator/MocR family aminotransferase
MVLPEALVKYFQRPLSITSQFPPLLLQAALADFIDDGYMTIHLKRMRRIYAQRRQLFRQMSEERLGKWLTLLPCDAGISFVGHLREGADDKAVAAAARRRNINISPLSIHYRHERPRPGLVMGYAALTESAMPSGFRQLEDALREALRG